jgi:hypothetical protein
MEKLQASTAGDELFALGIFHFKYNKNNNNNLAFCPKQVGVG